MFATSTVLIEPLFCTDACSFYLNDRYNITEGDLKLRHAVVAHHFWDRPGGGQLLCASAAHALSVAGFEPVLTSVTKINTDDYMEWFGLDMKNYDVVTLVNFKLRAFGVYLRLLVWVPMKRAIERFSADVVFTDECTYKPIEEFIKRRRIRLIEYLHFPIEVSVSPRFKGSGLYYGEDQYIVERYGKFPMNLYWRIYTKLLPLCLRETPFDTASVVLTNSSWTAKIAMEVFNDRPMVLNPPIAPNVRILEKPKEFDLRSNSVVMIGRFSEEKRYHWVVERLMPKLIREVGNVKLYIFGGAGTRASMRYVSKIEGIARRVGLRASRSLEAGADVYLIADAPRETINRAADTSKVFIHATVNEHWGIAVAEAMARGLPAVVHRSGGTWSDLVAEGEFGLGYTGEDEAVEAIARLLSDSKLWRSYSEKSVERARELELGKFVESFLSILKKIY